MFQKIIAKSLLSVILLIACSAKSQATLTLLINPDTEQFALSGSDSGNYQPITGGGGVAWAALLGMPNNDSVVTYDTKVAFSVSTGEVGNSVNGLDTQLSFASGLQAFILTLFYETSPNTITGAGVYQSYAALNPADKGLLASMDGAELLLLSGTGFESVSAQVIPEPASFLPLSIIAFVFAISRRRRILSKS